MRHAFKHLKSTKYTGKPSVLFSVLQSSVVTRVITRLRSVSARWLVDTEGVRASWAGILTEPESLIQSMLRGRHSLNHRTKQVKQHTETLLNAIYSPFSRVLKSWSHKIIRSFISWKANLRELKYQILIYRLSVVNNPASSIWSA